MIYCVEDETAIREIEVYALRSTGFEAEGFPDGESFFAALSRRMPELVLLDVMLPDMDGLEILRRLRMSAVTRNLPVIMATAKGEEYDKITGLDSGADDYLAKPFGMMEMVSRVRAVLRRVKPEKNNAPLCVDGLVLDTESYTVTADGEPVTLTRREFELLRTLMESPGTVFTRDRLLNEVWDDYYDGETRTVDVHIRTLRQKLGRCGSLIGTVRGLGYRLEASV